MTWHDLAARASNARIADCSAGHITDDLPGCNLKQVSIRKLHQIAGNKGSCPCEPQGEEALPCDSGASTTKRKPCELLVMYPRILGRLKNPLLAKGRRVNKSSP